MRKLNVAIFLLLIVNSVLAQKSQSELALDWKDGEYDVYKKQTTNGFTMTKLDEKSKIVIVKDEKGNVTEILFDKQSYKNKDAEYTDFVRYYSGSYTQLMFIGGYIAIFSATKNEDHVTLEYTIGKKGKSKTVDEIMEYLQKTREKEVISSFKGREKEIKSIELSAVTESGNAPKADEKFAVGIITTFNDGRVMKTKNLGGAQRNNEWILSSSQARKDKDESHPNGPQWTAVCTKIFNGEIAFDIKDYNEIAKFYKKMPFDCSGDKSEANVALNAWKEYDAISFYHKSVTLEEKIYDIKRDSRTGYTDHLKTIKLLLSNQTPDTLLVRVMKGNKYGFADKKGTIVIPAEYDDANPVVYTSKYAALKKGTAWGLVDYKNNTVIPFAYKNIGPFINGFACMEKDGKYGLISNEGKVFKEPEFSKPVTMRYGTAQVVKGGKCGYMNKTGEIIIPIVYDSIGSIISGCVVAYKGGKAGLIDKSGKEIIKFEYDYLSDLFEKNNCIAIKNGKYGVVNKSNAVIIPFVHDGLYYLDSEKALGSKKDDKYAIVDMKGKVLTEYKYDRLGKFGSTLASRHLLRVKEGDKYGYIKDDGNVFKECIYDNANDFITFGTVYKYSEAYNSLDKNKYYVIDDAYSFTRGFITIEGKESWESEGKIPKDYIREWASSSASSGSSSSNYTKGKSNNSSSTSGTSSNSTTKNNSNSAASSSSYSGSIKVINDTGKEVHLFLKKGGSGWWSPGSSKTIHCEEGEVVYVSLTNKSSDKTEAFKVESDMCGKTIKLSKYYK